MEVEKNNQRSRIRHEPGDERLVRLVPLGGRRRVIGFNGRINGPL